MDYRDFTIDDFLSDEFFLQWVAEPDTESNAFWETWFSENPEKRPVAEEAVRIARSVRFTEQWTDQEKLVIWQNIRQGMVARDENAGVVFKMTRRRLWLAAASIMLLLSSLGVLLNRSGMQEVRTSFGEISKITLADGSVVTLNANSRLRYDRNFLSAAKREIWIEGEAYFEVTRRIAKGKKVPFTVHANELSIQVLGTAFNVNNRRGTVNVVLEHGEVKVIDQKNNANQVRLRPGEGVTSSLKAQALQKRKVAVEDYASWKNRVIVFREKSLREIGQMMEDLYDMRVVIDNPALETETFTGSFPTDSSEVLFRKLEKMYPLEVSRIGREYHLR